MEWEQREPGGGSAPTAAPGWYEQPSGGLRYWNGTRWEDTPPPPPPPVSPVAEVSRTLGEQSGVFWLAGLCALGLIIGGFGPWATALNIVNVSGTQGDGWIAIGLGVFSLAMLWLYARRGSRGPVWWAAVAGVGGAILGFVDRANIAQKGSGDLFGEHVTLVRPAWGIYMVIVASIALVLTATALARSTGR